MQQSKEDRSLGDLFADLANQVSVLVRQEVRLARTEVSQKASSMGRDAGMLVAGGLVAYAGLLVLLGALVFGLEAAGLNRWLAALLVGLVVIAIGYYLVQSSLSNLKRTNLAPEQTLESLKEDSEWAKNQLK
ncbi:MAG: phage holin family protein [Chloroflexota bacterium]